MTNDALLSKTNSFLRFPLIVGVVLIHNNLEEINIQGKTISYGSWPWLSYLMEFFSSVLPTIAVPLFFFISGFLFFHHTDFDGTVYKKKLKSRCRTLLVTYLIRNFAGFLILRRNARPCFIWYWLLPTLLEGDEQTVEHTASI